MVDKTGHLMIKKHAFRNVTKTFWLGILSNLWPLLAISRNCNIMCKLYISKHTFLPLGKSVYLLNFCSSLMHFIFNTRHSDSISMLKPQTFTRCSLPVHPAGLLSAKLSAEACSCGHRSPTPPGRCSAEATGAETDRLLNVSVAQRTSAGCSPTARRVLVDCRLRRSVWCQVRTVWSDLCITANIFLNLVTFSWYHMVKYAVACVDTVCGCWDCFVIF